MTENITQNKGRDDAGGVWLALKLAWELGWLIALPVVGLGFSGAYLDKRLGTSPVFLLAGFVCAAVISCIAIKRRISVILTK